MYVGHINAEITSYTEHGSADRAPDKLQHSHYAANRREFVTKQQQLGISSGV